MTQEEIENASKEYLKNVSLVERSGVHTTMVDFKAGVKFAQGKLYSEIMSPKEMSEHILCSLHGVNITREECKQQALFCVNLKLLGLNKTNVDYWGEVKQKIQKT